MRPVRRFRSLRALLSLAVVMAAMPGTSHAGEAMASPCGGFCSLSCPSLEVRTAQCQSQYGGTCGLGSTCSSGQSGYSCGQFFTYISCLGSADE